MEIILQDWLILMLAQGKSEAQERPDVSLIDAAKRGDDDAFNALYTSLAPYVHSYARSKLRPEEVEDVVAEVFFRAWKKLSTFEGTEFAQLKGWVLKIAYHLTVDTYRTRKQVVDIEEAYELSDEENDADPSYVTRTALSYELVEERMKELPANYQEVIRLKYIHGSQNQEIAEIMDMTEGNVRTIAHRAIKRLQQLLERDITE